MRINIAKARVARGDPALGTLCTTSSPLMAEALGHAGYDFVVVDLQHGENNLGNLQPMLQALSSTPAVPMVRVPANMPVYIQRALDLGAYGIIVPLVGTAEEARRAVASLRYAPCGERSWGPVRGALYGGADYFDGAQAELVLLAMIETDAGLRNARDIMNVDGVDGCFIGPNDLSIALRHKPEQKALPAAVDDAIASILAAAQAAGKVGGIQCFDDAQARVRLAQGFRYVSVQSDLRMARATAATTLRALRPTQGGES
jgi:4-hydroxy-2-oxoheptanedioate aldolase